MYNKPTNFMELLKLQKVLDEKTSAERPNGFKPRPRRRVDIILALDDEFNEFMKELPDELNFKIWKEKEYNAEKQLIEWCDCLFFIAALINYEKDTKDKEFYFDSNWNILFDIYNQNNKGVLEFWMLPEFKGNLMDGELNKIFRDFILLSCQMNYDKETILSAYWSKWNKNMGRQNKDWSL